MPRHLAIALLLLGVAGCGNADLPPPVPAVKNPEREDPRAERPPAPKTTIPMH